MLYTGQSTKKFLIKCVFLLIFITFPGASLANSLSRKYEIILSKKPADVVSFSKMLIPSLMGSIDRIVLFLIPKVVENEDNYIITAGFFTVYKLSGVLSSYRKFCEKKGGYFSWTPDTSPYHEGMCLTHQNDAAAFYFKAKANDRTYYSDEVQIEIRAPKTDSFFSKDFLALEIQNGYKTPAMIEQINKKNEIANKTRYVKENIAVQAEFDKYLNKIHGLSLKSRSKLLKIGAEACTYTFDRPHNIIRGYVEAISNEKIKIALNGDMTKTIWTTPDKWYECSCVY